MNQLKSMFIISLFTISLAHAMEPLVAEEVLFDYSLGITGLSAELTNYQTELADINAQIATLQSATGYNTVVAPALTQLAKQQSFLITVITDLQETIAELNALANLDSEIKDQLYYFYTVLECSHVEFMVRMPFNYTIALADEVILNLLEDETNTHEVKVATAKLVFEKYPVSASHQRSLVKLYRYLE